MSVTRVIVIPLLITADKPYVACKLVSTEHFLNFRTSYRSIIVTNVSARAVQVSLLGKGIVSMGTITFGVIPNSAYVVKNVSWLEKGGNPDRLPFLENLGLSTTTQNHINVASFKPMGIDWEVKFAKPADEDPVLVVINHGYTGEGILAKVYFEVTIKCEGEAFGA